MELNTMFKTIIQLSIISNIDAVVFSVLGGTGHDNNTFECGQHVVLRCNAQPNSSLVRWHIDYAVASSSNASAVCLSSPPCTIFNNFGGRYNFKYNKTTGISDLIINPVNIEDDERQYRCNDLHDPQIYEASVQTPPSNSSITNDTKTSTIGTEFRVRTGCIYPANRTKFVWYSSNINGTERKYYLETNETITKCKTATNDCEKANKSEEISSVLTLNLPKTTYKTRSLRLVHVEIEFDGKRLFDMSIGTYMETVTQSTNTVTGSGLSVSAIIALSVAIPSCTIVVVILVIVIVCCIRHRRIKASDAPGTPVGFELVRDSVTEVSAAFRCRPKPYQPGKQEIVLFCQQAINGTHTADNSQIIDDAGARAITLRINNLRQGCVYDCSVFARNNNIRSANSEKIRIKTLGLPDAPTDFRVVRVENNCIHLSWIPGRYRMNQQSFVLELLNMKNGDITLEPIRMAHVIPLMHTVEGLPVGTTFIVNLRAKNDVGDSDNVGPIEVSTTGNPEPPSELKEAGVTSSSITISWCPGAYRRQTQYFVIEYGRKKKKLENIKWKQKKKVDDVQTVMMYTLKNLKSATAYVIVIFARNDIGESKRTLPLQVNTKEENFENNDNRTRK